MIILKTVIILWNDEKKFCKKKKFKEWKKKNENKNKKN
jgi:hypothetical protein